MSGGEVREKLIGILQKQRRIDLELRQEYLIEYAKILSLSELLIEKGIITAKEFKAKYIEHEHKISKDLLEKIHKRGR